VAAFGNTVHVAGQDEALLQQALQPLLSQLPGLRCERAAANLEDVFISLIASAKDNFGGEA